MKPQILIVGANGYIGRHLVYELISQHVYDLTLTDIHDRSFYFQNENYFRWDIVNADSRINSIIKSCHFAFFLSGLTGTTKSIDDYNQFISTNEIGFLNFLSLLKQYNRACKVIFPSTRLVYKGKKNTPIIEDDKKELKTIYAVNKFSCENYLDIFFQCYGINYTIFRLCVPYGNTIGNNLSYGTISHFLKKAMAKEKITVFGDGNQKRTLTHVHDLVRIIAAGGLNSQTNNDIFNVGGPDHLTIKEIALKIAEKFSVDIDYEKWPDLDEKIETGDTIFDSSKFDKITNYKYSYDFQSWLSRQ